MYSHLRHVLLGDDALEILGARIEYGTNLIWLNGVRHQFKRPLLDGDPDNFTVYAVVEQYKHLTPSVFSVTIGNGEKFGVEMTIDTGSAHRPAAAGAATLSATIGKKRP